MSDLDVVDKGEDKRDKDFVTEATRSVMYTLLFGLIFFPLHLLHYLHA